MTLRAWMLAALVAAAQPALAAPPDKDAGDSGDKSDTSQDLEACKQQQRAEGEKTELKTAIKCAVKVAFQSRIRRKKDEEPVEMTIGSPPMVTDDTDTPGDGNWEINLGAAVETGGGEHRIEFPSLDLNYGIGEKLQLTYEVPYAFVRAEDDATGGMHSASGFGDSTVGLKYRFYDDKESGLSFAIYPQLEFRTPGANRRVSENETGFVLPLVMTKEYEHFAIGANLGGEFSDGDQRLFASFGGGWRLSDRTAMFAELAGTDLNASDEKRVALNFGLRHKISENHSVSGSLGRDVYAGGGQARQTYFKVAWQINIGK